MTTRRRLAALGALALPLALVTALGGPAGATPGREGGLRTVQRLPALPVGALREGLLTATQQLSMRFVLQPRDRSELTSFIDAVSSPSSPSFRHFLARGAFARRFGPSAAAVGALSADLRRDGLTVTGLSASRLVLSVRGPVAGFSLALHAPVVRWRLPDGSVGYRLGRAARLPAAVAADVAGVVGVSSLERERSLAVRVRGPDARRDAVPGARGVRPRLSPLQDPCAGLVAQTTDGSFTPYEEGQAYGLDTAWEHGDDGTGHTIAVEEFAPYATSDLLTYDKCVGLLPSGATSDPRVRNLLVDGGTSPGSSAASDEPTLDVEELRALAPGADVDVYLGPNNVTGPIDLLQRIATDDTAQAVSISWGICEAFSDHQDETPIFEQMAAQGQTVFAASGDSGSSDCLGDSLPNGPLLVGASVDDPASQPLVTGVGGLTVDQLSPLDETVWNDCVTFDEPGCLGDAGGGGVSSAYPRPSWQVAPGTPTGSARGADARLVPDLSVMADPGTGMVVYLDGSYQPIGGTSMSAPLMAALDVVAAQACGVGTLGFLNPLLYAMGRHGGDFEDVTTGNNAVATQTLHAGEWKAGVGYDMASGLGSPDPATFLPALCDGPATASASPATPSTASLWQVGFHTGSSAYPVGATVTLTAPPGTGLPASAGSWLVDDGTTSDAPSAVSLAKGARSSTDNVATLTLAQGITPVDLVTIDALSVENPASVGAATVAVADSVDHLVETAPLELGTASASAARSSVRASATVLAVGGAGATVSVTARDAAGDLVLGEPVAVTASGRGRASLVRASTDDDGTATFELRDDRPERTVATVDVGGARVGSVAVRFTDPWSSRVLHVAPGLAALGRVLGTPATVATGRGDGWVGLVRLAQGRLAAVVPRGTRLATALLAAAPPATSDPSLVRAGAWLYATYRSTAGDLVLLSQAGGTHLSGWRASDLTQRRLVPHVLDTPRAFVGVAGTAAVLSLTAVSASHLVWRVDAPVTDTAHLQVLDVSDAASQPADATGAVDEVRNGTQDAFVFRTTNGRLMMVARDDGRWLGNDLAQTALVSASGGNAIEGDPTTVPSPLGFDVVATTRDHRVEEFVGTFGNWSAESISAGAAGTTPPAGHATLPSLAGTPVVEAAPTSTSIVVATTGGRLDELRSPGVADPWAAYDLTTLAHLGAGAVSGVAALPGTGVALLVADAGRLVLVRGGTA